MLYSVISIILWLVSQLTSSLLGTFILGYEWFLFILVTILTGHGAKHFTFHFVNYNQYFYIFFPNELIKAITIGEKHVLIKIGRYWPNFSSSSCCVFSFLKTLSEKLIYIDIVWDFYQTFLARFSQISSFRSKLWNFLTILSNIFVVHMIIFHPKFCGFMRWQFRAIIVCLLSWKNIAYKASNKIVDDVFNYQWNLKLTKTWSFRWGIMWPKFIFNLVVGTNCFMVCKGQFSKIKKKNSGLPFSIEKNSGHPFQDRKY